MQGMHLLVPIFIPGTLTANVHFEFIVPFNMTLLKVSANCDASTSFILDIGTTADTDAYLDAVTVTGDATDSTEYGLADFVDAAYPHIVDGTMVVVTVDYDGGAGADSAGVSLLLTFGEG